jgi:two-component system response regulator YesN
MPYKVFLVEDEIVTREGIRDNVNWEADGFQFCGEASDGEMALSLLDAARPDVLITDIRMPFMDGLQLSKIVRDRMPHTKIVILSGHDEFQYAQAAIKLGVTEYLLKPVGVQDLHDVLRRVAALIERERRDEADLHHLQSQVAESRAALRQSLLLRLVMGMVSAADAIEQAQALGMDLVARWYLVGLVQVGNAAGRGPNCVAGVQQIAADVTRSSPDVYLLCKNSNELVLILKGHAPEHLRAEADFLLGSIIHLAEAARCPVQMGMGAPKPHLRDLYYSFVEALGDIQVQAQSPLQAQPDDVGGRTPAGPSSPGRAADRAAERATERAAEHGELLKVDKLAVGNYLRYGVKEDVDGFLSALVRPLSPAAQQSPLLKNYLLMDIVVAAAQFVHELGGDVGAVVPDLTAVEDLLTAVRTVGEILPQARTILLQALEFRDSYLNEPYAAMMRQVKQHLATHYADPALSLPEVARAINLSPSHFSMVFGQESGTTFRSYLTEIRIGKAKELLRTTTLRPSEIAVQVGYSDPHYFSHVFRKQTGLTPTEFRSRPRGGSA